jgi:hypothetical protein
MEACAALTPAFDLAAQVAANQDMLVAKTMDAHRELEATHHELLRERSLLKERVHNLELDVRELREALETERDQLRLLADSYDYVKLFKADGGTIVERVSQLREASVNVVDALKPSSVIKGFSMLTREFTDSEQGAALLSVLQQAHGSATKFHKMLGALASDVSALWVTGKDQFQEEHIAPVATKWSTRPDDDDVRPKRHSKEISDNTNSRRRKSNRRLTT